MFIYMMMIDSPEDQSKFEQVYKTYKGLMFHVANKILENDTDAEDAVHNAFVKIAENISKISEPVGPKTKIYVLTIVEHKAIDLYRSNQKSKNVAYLDEISGITVEEHRVHGLATCMARLESRYRQILLLKYYEGFSNKEIAKMLDLKEANVVKLDQRAKKHLQKLCIEEGIL